MQRALLKFMLWLAATSLIGGSVQAQEDTSGLLNAPGRLSVAPFPERDRAADMQAWSGTGWNVVHFEVITGQLDSNSALGVDLINTPDRAGLTPLHYAVSMGNFAPVQLLLDNGADVNASALGGFSVLHAACQFGDTQMVRKLLEAGADPRRLFRGDWQWLSDGVLDDDPSTLRGGMQAMLTNESWDAGISCLHLAAAAGNSELVAMLLARKLDPGLPTLLYAVTPLHLCVTAPACTSLLLEAGADPDSVEDFAGLTPLFGSTFENAGLLLASGANPDALNSWGYGMLHIVESETMARLLLDNGADSELRGTYGETPLMSAADRGLEGVVGLLLEGGADVNAADFMARTALDRALDAGRQSISEMLRLAGGLEGFDMHPFHYTAAQGELLVLKLALEAGEDVNVSDGCGWTALHFAAMSGSTDCVGLLLDAGAEVNATDGTGATALTRSALSPAELVSLLLDAGADANAYDPWFRSSLLRACSRGDETAATALLNNGADANAVGKAGIRPLMLAAQGGNAVLLQRLLDSGAQLDSRDEEGMTALMHAVDYSSYYGEACSRLLLDAGADTSAVDAMGRSVLHHLAMRGSVKLASRLVEAGSPHLQPDMRGYSPARLARLAGNEILASWLETLP